MNSKLKPKILCIVGPTSSGKTSLSLKLAKKYNGEIISADSRQIYKEMNIGTNKITGYKKSKIAYKIPEFENPVHAVEYQGIVHYLIDVVSPDEDYKFSLYQFQQTAKNLIRDIHKRGKYPIMAGGTGLYISSVVDNLQIPAVPRDKELRSKLEQMKTRDLYKLFKSLDKTGKHTIDRKNRRRLIRGIEISKNAKKQKSVLRRKGPKEFKIRQIGLKVPRDILYKRINKWVDFIFGKSPKNSPIVKETKALIRKYKPENNMVLNGLIYKQIIAYLTKQPSQLEKGKPTSFEEAKELAKIATRHYSKRQMTWFRKDKTIEWMTKEMAGKIKL